jgi:hypothetical protein
MKWLQYAVELAPKISLPVDTGKGGRHDDTERSLDRHLQTAAFRAIACLAFSGERLSAAQQARKDYELFECDRLLFRIQWMKAATPGLLAVSLGHTK